MREFRDLTAEEKAKIVGGSAMVATLFSTFLVFWQFFVEEDRLHLGSLWESGSSVFSVMSRVAPYFFLVVVLPAAIAGSAVGGWFARHSALRNALFILLGLGAWFSVSILLLTLFDMLFFSLPALAQIPLMLIAFFLPASVLTLSLRAKRIHNGVKKMLGQQASL